ncbi:LysE family transporter [Photobacterium sp. SDRW27]|uniref:LysE family translocator n=1 Tax=Photobacterium obscurum TaxID=2829490 RepID=UPI002244E046|nr:LysE family transporter [Photobacterium obscurum]MCW8327675.1 LysE family transporter [Photobacterium obscurum]
MEVVKAFLFGLILSLSIGPIAILILNNGIQHGYTVAVRSAIGAALADYCYALVSFMIGTWIITTFAQFHYQIILLSSWVLIFAGFYMMFGALQNTKLLANFKRPTKKLGFRATFYLTMANPIAVIALSAFIGHSTSHLDLLFALQLAGAIFMGSLLIQCVLAISGSIFKSHFETLTFPFYLQLLGGLMICLFGVYNFVELAN